MSTFLGNELVSIIIPVYNGARFLTETLKRVVDQTHANWEIILVDDGSSDNSVEIIKDFISGN